MKNPKDTETPFLSLRAITDLINAEKRRIQKTLKHYTWRVDVVNIDTGSVEKNPKDTETTNRD